MIRPPDSPWHLTRREAATVAAELVVFLLAIGALYALLVVADMAVNG